MMNSDHHLHESEPLHGGDNRLHHRDVAININDGASSNQPLHRSNSNNGRTNGRHSPPPQAMHTRKRRVKKTNFWDRTSGRMNDGKYGKRKAKRSAQIQQVIFWGSICVASFVLGFALTHFWSKGPPSSSNLQPSKLRHPPDTTKGEIPPDPYAKLTADEHKQQPQTEKKPTIQSLLIPRFDTKRYVNSWANNMKYAANEMLGKKRPQAIQIGTWNSPVAFRAFPYARQTHGPIKNIDSDYGGLTFYSLRNEKKFARTIPKDTVDAATPGGFDPDAIAPDQNLKRRNRTRRQQEGSYPEFKPDGTKVLYKDAGLKELKSFYDDDSIKVMPRANDGKTPEPRTCQKPEFSQLYFPTCNNFHDRDLGRVHDDPEKMVHPRPENELYVKYLAHGFYRDGTY